MNPYIPLPKIPTMCGRQQVVIDYCRDRCVLHVGCVNVGLVEKRFALNELMHQKLAQVATDFWGIDVDADGIEFLRSCESEQLLIGDAAQLHHMSALSDGTFDVIVASEVVEHLDNPNAFFQSVKHLMLPERTLLLVTVPNAFRINTLLWLLRDVEYVHPDRNYWISYRTITNHFVKNGLSVQSVFTYRFKSQLTMPNALKRMVGKRPAVQNGAQRKGNSTKSVGLATRAIRYARVFPKRALVSFLYKRPAFWADGLVVVATLSGSASRQDA